MQILLDRYKSGVTSRLVYGVMGGGTTLKRVVCHSRVGVVTFAITFPVAIQNACLQFVTLSKMSLHILSIKKPIKYKVPSADAVCSTKFHSERRSNGTLYFSR